MKKLLLFLTLCVLLFSCEKPSQDSLDVEVGESSYALTSDYHLCSNLYDAYFDFFNNHMDAGYLEAQVTAICHDFGFDIDYYAEHAEFSDLALSYLESVRGAAYVSLDDLFNMFIDEYLSNEEKVFLCLDAAAVNVRNKYQDIFLITETVDGKFVIEQNPSNYIETYGLSLEFGSSIIYQPYNANSFSVDEYSNPYDFMDALDGYYANEETEDDCLKTYQEEMEKAENRYLRNIYISFPIAACGLPAYAVAVLTCMVEFKVAKERCWREYVDCVKSVDKIIFIES